MVDPMSTLHQELLLGATSQIVDCLCPDGRPASVTSVTIHATDADDSTIAATCTGATIDSVSTTTTAAAGDETGEPSTIALTSATGVVVGRTYLLQDASGLNEWVVVAAVSSNTVTAKHNLRNEYATGATFKSTRIYATVPDAWAAATNNLTSPEKRTGYRVRWVYVGSDGKTHTVQTTVALVRYQTRNQVLPVHIDARFPGWLERLPTDYRSDQGKGLIDAAFESVRLDLLQEGQSDHAMRDPAVFSELVVHKTIEIASEVNMRNGGGSLEAVEVARTGYTERLTRLVKQAAVDVQHSPGGASAAGKRRNIFSR